MITAFLDFRRDNVIYHGGNDCHRPFRCLGRSDEFR